MRMCHPWGWGPCPIRFCHPCKLKYLSLVEHSMLSKSINKNVRQKAFLSSRIPNRSVQSNIDNRVGSHLIRQQNKKNQLINDRMMRCYWNLHKGHCVCVCMCVRVCLESSSNYWSAKFKQSGMRGRYGCVPKHCKNDILCKNKSKSQTKTLCP